MSRKFLYSMHALVSNYSSNQITHMVYSNAGVWSFVENITAGPSSSNLSSLASNIQGSRVLYTNYAGGSVVPLNYSTITWTPGTPIVIGGNPSEVAMSADGMHALASGDFLSTICPLEYNLTTGLWVPSTPVATPGIHYHSIQMTSDATRALCVQKYGSTMYALARNPVTGWSLTGQSFTWRWPGERSYSIGISPDGNTAVIGCNTPGGINDSLVWNGTLWVQGEIPIATTDAVWRPDGLSVLGTMHDRIEVINYDPSTHAFSSAQTIATAPYSTVYKINMATDGIGDLVIASDFSTSTLLPLSRSRATGLWSIGTPLHSSLLESPWNAIIFPIW